MTRIAAPVATVLLIAIGAIEASVSAQQLSALRTPPRLEEVSVTLTAAGFLASAVIYLVLGRLAADERAALRVGAATGILAGLVGGSMRALIISESVGGLVNRYAAVPDFFVPVALAVFVLLSGAASALGGGTLAWTGRRLSRAARSRPPA